MPSVPQGEKSCWKFMFGSGVSTGKWCENYTFTKLLSVNSCERVLTVQLECFWTQSLRWASGVCILCFHAIGKIIPKLVLRLVLNYFTLGGRVCEQVHAAQWIPFTVKTYNMDLHKQGGWSLSWFNQMLILFQAYSPKILWKWIDARKRRTIMYNLLLKMMKTSLGTIRNQFWSPYRSVQILKCKIG